MAVVGVKYRELFSYRLCEKRFVLMLCIVAQNVYVTSRRHYVLTAFGA